MQIFFVVCVSFFNFMYYIVNYSNVYLQSDHQFHKICEVTYCTARQCSPLRRKFMECSKNSSALSLLMKHLVIGQHLKTPNFSAFHWSPRGSLVSIGQHFVDTRVVHLPKSTKTSLITESDQRGPNHLLLQLCTVRTAWSDSDQAVRAVHSCNSWLCIILLVI